MATIHSEPYIYLAGLTDTAALVTWGAFYFRTVDGGPNDDWKVIEEKDLKAVFPKRSTTIGASSESYGDAVVTVKNGAGAKVAEAHVSRDENKNHVWIHGLAPD